MRGGNCVAAGTIGCDTTALSDGGGDDWGAAGAGGGVGGGVGDAGTAGVVTGAGVGAGWVPGGCSIVLMVTVLVDEI